MVLSKLRGFPLIWNTLAGSVLFAAADVSQQKIERRPVYDPGSTGRYMVVGGVFGPMSYVWHTKLEQFLPGNTRSMVVKKVFLTSSITGAIFNFLFYTRELHALLNIARIARYTLKYSSLSTAIHRLLTLRAVFFNSINPR